MLGTASVPFSLLIQGWLVLGGGKEGGLILPTSELLFEKDGSQPMWAWAVKATSPTAPRPGPDRELL